jgi:hypothetical protein
MKRPMLFLLCVLTIGAATVALRARQENQPGMPTTARMFILNRGGGEAVPVMLHPGVDAQPVTFSGAPAVTVAASAVLPVRQARVAWEYQRLAFAPGDEAMATLDRAGLEGWEAVGVVSDGPGRMALLLKRPR